MKSAAVSRLKVAFAFVLLLYSLSTLAGAEGADSTVPASGGMSALARAPQTAPPDNPEVSALPSGLAEGGLIAKLIDSGWLTVALVNLERYPFFYTDAAGQLVGSDVDLARDIAHELGVELTFNRSANTFNGVVELVAKGQADIAISKLSITLPRAAQVRFTEPYIELAQGLLLNRVALTAMGGTDKTASSIIALLDREGVRLGAVKGSSYVGFSGALFPRAQLTEFPDKQALFAAVLSGEITSVLYDENEIKQYIFDQPDRLINLKVQMLADRPDPIGIAVSDPQLQYWLNTYLYLKRVHLSVNDLLKNYPRPEAHP